MKGIAGRRALVTGGGSGIGLACAEALSAAGAEVTVLGRRSAPLEAAVAAGAARHALVADVTAPPPLPGFALLVNAAGAAESAPFLASDDALWQRMLSVNLLGAVAVTRAVLPDMLAAKQGRIVHIASTASRRGYPYVSAYVAAKHGLLGLVRSLALEVAAKGVTVNAVCPGFTETELLAESVARIVAKTGRSAEQAREDLARGNPQGRFVTPDQVAATALFLCSEQASGINGQAVAVDGGETS